MAAKNQISQDSFERLLDWLDADRQKAGQKYESIRMRLIKIFYARGCHLAEEMADETIDRVTGKIESLFDTYQGDPAIYFYGVAQKIILEYSRKPKTVELSAIAEREPENENIKAIHECLDKCLQNFSSEQRDFILRYYSGDKHAKLEERKRMETDLQISSENLRVRAFRVRKSLQKCVLTCISQTPNVTF
jgi:DNA-directed RNA polymerase specialized sigma24 family protein